MAARTYTYYTADNQTVEGVHSFPSRWSWDQAMPGVEPGRWFKGYGYIYGYINKQRVPVARMVAYKNHNPSLHECDGRCMSAKGHNCECECGGLNHGVAA